MIKDQDKQEFIKLFAERLQQAASSNDVALNPIQGNEIARKFVAALIQLKTTFSNDSSLHNSVRGELAWSKKRAEHTELFAETLAEIFKPVGGISPKDMSAYWSGAGVKRAAKHGVNLEKTIPGAVMNQVSASLQEVFTKEAYKPDGTLDTATNLAVWDAMSKLYAQGTTQDAHVFLVNGETGNRSIFWNTELNTLRERQNSGEVKEIYIHTLKPKALATYQALLESKNDIPLLQQDALEAIQKKINDFLQDSSNWENEILNESNAFKLRTSGPREDLKTIDYQRVKEIAQRFKSFGPEKKTVALETKLNEINQSFSAGGDYKTYKKSLESLKQQVQQLQTNKFCNETTLLRLEKLEHLIEDTLIKAKAGPDEDPSDNFTI